MNSYTTYRIVEILRQHLPEEKIAEILRAFRNELVHDPIAVQVVRQLCQQANT